MYPVFAIRITVPMATVVAQTISPLHKGIDCAGCMAKQRVLKLKKNRVLCMGHQPFEQLRPIIQHAACCVFPSRVDNLPNTCLEAMSLGVPVIGTRGASFEQLIDDGVSGLLIKIDSASQLRDAVLRLLGLPEEMRAEMGAQALKRAAQNNGAAVAEKLTAFYQEVIKQHEQKRS